MLSFLAWVWKEKILLGLTFLFVTRANIAVFFLLLWQKFKLNLNILVTAVTIVCYLGPISYHDHVMDAVVLERVLLADTKEYAFSKNTVTGPDSSNSHFVVTREEHQPQNLVQFWVHGWTTNQIMNSVCSHTNRTGFVSETTLTCFVL